MWSWRWDLNPQPADYKSAALPIELRQQIGHFNISFSAQSLASVQNNECPESASFRLGKFRKSERL
jgi:hypothetical protein